MKEIISLIGILIMIMGFLCMMLISMNWSWCAIVGMLLGVFVGDDK